MKTFEQIFLRSIHKSNFSHYKPSLFHRTPISKHIRKFFFSNYSIFKLRKSRLFYGRTPEIICFREKKHRSRVQNTGRGCKNGLCFINPPPPSSLKNLTAIKLWIGNLKINKKFFSF